MGKHKNKYIAAYLDRKAGGNQTTRLSSSPASEFREDRGREDRRERPNGDRPSKPERTRGESKNGR